jgi:ABC-2 type transport system ATP-binding protein
MAAIIQIQNLTKNYGERTAVDQLNLEVQEGDIFGFVGPNGAGKTSTIRIMATLLQLTAGEILIAGHSVQQEPRQVRRVIGYMPDFFGVYQDMKVWEYLDFFAACYHIHENERGRLIDDLLELVDLSHRREDMVEKLSRGMKQRLSLARTLIHDPQVLILDEPASGLDPRARVEIRELLLELSSMGKTIFFSTHILADVAEICTRVAIIEAGKPVAAGPLEDLQQQLMPHRQIEIFVLGEVDPAQKLLLAAPGVTVTSIEVGKDGSPRGKLEIELAGDDEALSGLLNTLVVNGVRVVHFSENRRDLEEVFMRATKGLVT